MNKVIGLTGGIASGKSTVVDFLRSKGYQVIDADQVVHELQEPGGQLYREILANLGSDFFKKDGKLDREKLSSAVFSDVLLRNRLAELQNKIIREELYKKRNQFLNKKVEHGIFFMDIPLLFEQNYNDFSEVWVINISEEIQIARLMKRNDLSRKEALLRIKAQMPLADKIKLADRVLNNSGTRAELQKQMMDVLEKLEEQGNDKNEKS